MWRCSTDVVPSCFYWVGLFTVNKKTGPSVDYVLSSFYIDYMTNEQVHEKNGTFIT